MRHILTKILLISAMVSTLIIPVAQANDDTQMESILVLNAIAYRLLGEVSFYSLQQGAGRTEQRLQQVITDGNDLLAQMEQVDSVLLAWQQAVAFIEQHKDVAATMSDVNFITDLQQHHQPLLVAIAEMKGRYEEDAVYPYPRQRAQLALEHIVAEYMYFNINVFGGHAITEMEIQNNNRLLKSLFTELPISDQEKNDLQRKWSFIERTVLNYNKTSAHFIVMRTADSVRDGLR